MNREFLGESLAVWGAIIFALLAKFLFMGSRVEDVDLPPVRRRYRTAFSLVAGFICGYWGPDIVIRWVDYLLVDDKVFIALMLAFTGEHLVRSILALDSETIRELILRYLRGPSK